MKPLAITCGDPAGVGPELVAAWLQAHPKEASEVAVIGPAHWLEQLPPAGRKVPVGLEEFVAVPGIPTGEGALAAWAAMEHAAAGCRNGEYLGVVTAPVSKEWLVRIGYPFPGQTEFFAQRWGGEPTMAFCGGRLTVVLLSWHVPFREVPAQLTPSALKRSIAAADQLVRRLGHASGDPRIAVCGLNPHAGEGGLMGDEERERIDPVLDQLRGEFPRLSRAIPGDTAFARQLRGEFDVVVALYHDQGLAPLKVIDFDDAVNVTLGLPYVRTSPDHGTAFSLAGSGTAQTTSFNNAVAMARRLA